MKTRTRSFVILLLLITALLFALLVFGIYDVKGKNEEASRLLNLLDRRAEEESLSFSIRGIQSGIAEDVGKFEELTLSSDNLVGLLEDIEGAGKSLGLATSIVSVEKLSSEEGGPNTIFIELETAGAWARSLAFLESIESLPHRVVMHDVNFSKGVGLWRARITLSLFIFDK